MKMNVLSLYANTRRRRKKSPFSAADTTDSLCGVSVTTGFKTSPSQSSTLSYGRLELPSRRHLGSTMASPTIKLEN